MAPRDNPYTREFAASLEGWTDQRFVTREQIRTLSMFSLYLVNLLEEEGWCYYGHSHTQKGRIGCLVVKADREGTPHVVFTNALTHIGCVTAFLRKLEEDTLDWRLDRYRT